jgi:hypothetical protein
MAQNHLKQLGAEPLRWEMAVADFLETFQTWLPLEHFHNAKWIWQQSVGMFFKKCTSEVRGVRKKARQGNKRPAPDLGERTGNTLSSKVSEFRYTTIIVVIC